jgi:hypothetical protein
MHNLKSPSDTWLSWMQRLYISWEACRHCLHAIVNSFHTSHLETPDIINLSIWNLADRTNIHSTERAFYHKWLVKNLEFATNYVQVLAILRDLWKAFFRQDMFATCLARDVFCRPVRWGDAAMGIWDSNTDVAAPHVKAQQTASIQSLEQLLQGNQLHSFCWRM